MKKGDVYRKAAQLLEDFAQHSPPREGTITFSCCAVAEAEGRFDDWNHHRYVSRLVNEYRDIFDGDFDFRPETGRNERILALCFMAAICDRPD